MTSLSINLVAFKIIESYSNGFVSSAREYSSQRIYDISVDLHIDINILARLPKELSRRVLLAS